MSRARVAPAALLAALLSGCHQPVEYSTTLECGVIKLSVPDNTVVGSVAGIEDGRALCSVGSTGFIVLAGSGMLYGFDSESMILDTSYVIGSGSGSGYSQAVRSGSRYVYTVGDAGNLLEVDIEEGMVVDEFQAGPFPVALCASASNGYLYVADGSDLRVREVDPSGNEVLRESDPLGAVPTALSAETFLDEYLLVCCADEDGTVERITLGTFYSSETYVGAPGTDMAAFQSESIWAVVHPDWYGENGSITLCYSFSLPQMTEIDIAGHPTDLCSVPGTNLCYVLSYLGEGTSRVTAVDYFTAEVIDYCELEGFPWDITSHANGEYVLVLTSEL